MSKVKTIKLGTEIPEEEIAKLEGKKLDESYFDILIDSDTDVFTPSGEPLLLYRHNILPAAVCKAAYNPLREAGKNAHGNRGMAAGEPEEMKIYNRKAVPTSKNSKVRIKPIKLDGTVSNTSYAQAAPSNVIGFYNREARFPYCRLTAFNMHHADLFREALPYIRCISEVFKALCPERYEAQRSVIEQTSPDFVIPGTAFTTITVNYNFVTATHKDVGDLKEGFGVMSVLRGGNYTGGYLIFPQYRVAVDMKSRGVLLANVHCYHGNSPIKGIKGTYERISTVSYYREKMVSCGTAAQELERAKKRQRGDKLHERITDAN